MIPLAVPNLGGNERKYLNACIDTTFVSSVGQFVNTFEKMVADECGTDDAVATSSGTTGLHLALRASGVDYGDLVIIPTFTFIATANAVAHCGAFPWLMDITPDSWTLDIAKVENEIERHTIWQGGKLIHKESRRRVAAIMPVYTLGNIPDMDSLDALGEKYELPVIADAAAALGAGYKDKKIGALADLTVFSFNGNKTVTAGGGGAVVGKNRKVIEKIRHLSTTARVTAEYDHDMVGYNYRMTNLQAAVGCAQIEQLETFVEKKRAIRVFYQQVFADIKGIETFPEHLSGKSACWFSGIVLKDGNVERIRELCIALREAGIEARSFWKPVHLQRPYAEAPRAEALTEADHLWSKILTLPCSTNITTDELEYVVKKVKELL